MYIDEVMFTAKTQMNRTWAGRHHPITIDRKLSSSNAIACVAAVSASGGLELMMQFERSVDKNKFEEFLRELR